MKRIYAKDIPEFTLEDWEDMFAQLEVDYESWTNDDKVEIADHYNETFIFDKVGVRENPLPFSDETRYLIDDIVTIRELRKNIYRAPMKVFDRELEAGLEEVAEVFQEAQDSATNRVLKALLELA